MKRVPLLLLTIALSLLLGLPASATVYTLNNGNSSFSVDDCVGGCSQGHGPGMYSWTVDGIETLYEQWFWYRVGNAGGESSVDTLQLIGAQITGTILNPNSVLDIAYQGNGFTIDLAYSLRGGAPNSNTGDIGEQITINVGASALDFHFFQYSDFDLNRNNLHDYVVIDPTYHIVNQWPEANGLMISETTVNQRPSHGEANYFANTLASLQDGNPTTLNDVLTAGPGDVTWAFEWDQAIGAGGSLVISKDKLLAPNVPEPAAVTLLGGVLLLIARKLRTRKA